MTDTNDEPFGHRYFARVTKSLPGRGRLVQVWVLRARCTPDDEMHHTNVSSYVGDMNVVGNKRLPSEGGKTVKDPGITGWESVPEDVREEFLRIVPDGTKMMNDDGERVELRNWSDDDE